MIIALVGGCGKLGTATYEMLKNKNSLIRVDVAGGDVSSLEGMNCVPDVIVDLSCAEQSMESLKYALEHARPIVIACTGHTSQQTEELKLASHSIPIFLAYNMAFGMQLFKQAALFLAQNFEGEIYLHEVHHKHKKDIPSGTAKEIERLISSCGKSCPVTSARGGDVVGEHILSFYGNGENIEIKHTALSRTAFASGIQKAIEFVSDKSNGFFGMSDLTKK